MPVRRVLPLVLVALISPAAGAAPKLFVDLRYETDQALERCPSEAEFRAMIREQLGYDPFAVPSQQTVVATARADEAGIRGVIEWYSAGAPRGQRELASEMQDCAAFMRAMSFAIAVQIQLLADEQNAPPATAPERVPEAQKAAPPSDTQHSAQASAAGARSWHFLVGVGPAVAFGLTPQAAFEGRIFTTARYGAVGIELGGEASLPASHTLDSGDGFEQWTAAGSLSGCGFFRAFAGCLVNKLGTLSVRGFGVDVPRSDSGLIAQLGLRLAVSHALVGPAIGALRVEALAALTSWDITLNDREVWQTPPLSLVVGADFAAVFQ